MIYTYECPQCGQFDFTQSIKDNPLSSCPQCGQNVERVITGGYGSFIKGRTLGAISEMNSDKMGVYERDFKNQDIIERKANAPPWRPNTLGPNMELAKKTPEQLKRYIQEGK